ncbi:O-antigen ligase family protein [bacterium]|nr:O-antigen ligase family protein [bacterium]
MDRLERVVENGLYLLVFLLPWQTRWIALPGELNYGYWEYGTISLYGTDILLLGLVLSFGVLQLWQRRIVNFQLPFQSGFPVKQAILNIWYLLAVFELVVFISIFFSADKTIAFYGYGRILLGISLFALIVNLNYEKFKLIYAFLGGLLIQASIGIWQFLTQSSFASKWLGAAAVNPADLGISVIETLNKERWLRAYGTMSHPNILGGILVIGILLAIGLILTRNRDEISSQGTKLIIGRFATLNCSNLFFPCFLHICSLIFLTCLFFTFSRGAWAGLLAGVVILLFLASIKRDLLAQKLILEIILVSSILIFILTTVFSGLVLTRFSKDTRLEVKSNIERIASFKEASGIIKKNWLRGIGIGNYTKVLEKNNPGKPSYIYQPVHNVYFLVLAELGVIGYTSFFTVLLFVFTIAIIKFSNSQYLKTSNLALIIAFFIMFLVDHWFFSLHLGILVFWFILGIIFRDVRKLSSI